MDTERIVVSTSDSRERRRRRRELYLALFCFVLIAVLTFVELRYLGVGSNMFVVLSNLTFILILLILFIVIRNGVKLLLERRRNVLGSRLRTRLVLAFISLSLVPTALMFLVSLGFVQTSVDYWFQARVEDSMRRSLEVGQAFYSEAQERLEQRSMNIIDAIVKRQFAWGGKGMDNFLDEKFKEYHLSILSVVTPDGKTQNSHAEKHWDQTWPEISARIDWDGLRTQPRYWSSRISTSSNDLIVGLVPVDGGKTGYLLLAESIGQGLWYKMEQVVRGLDEYRELRSLKTPWKWNLYLILGVMTMLIVLGAVWFGFRLAKELSAPIQALASGTERVAAGDLSVRLDDQSDDEMGLLVQSFNRMTEDLQESQRRLRAANERLAQQNVEQIERNRYIEAVIDTITSGVVSMDADGRVGSVNKAAEGMLGITGRFLMGKRPRDLLQGDFADLMGEAMDQLHANPTSQWQRQINLTIRGRNLRFLVNVVALRGAGGVVTGTVAVFEDITELEKMQRLAAWREVARRIAHEIKNPLTPIKLSAQRLQRKYGDAEGDPVFEECTQLIVTQVERIQQMVTEFSAYAKLPEVVPKPGDLPSLLEEMVAMFRTTHREIEWGLELAPDIPRVSFDREALRQVFINLLTNAVEAFQNAGQTDGRVDVHVQRDLTRGVVTISVFDNGPGFSLEESSRMFEPYFSNKKSGTGLGLAIVRSIVNDHKGQVYALPDTSRGTAFFIDLPLDA